MVLRKKRAKSSKRNVMLSVLARRSRQAPSGDETLAPVIMITPLEPGPSSQSNSSSQAEVEDQSLESSIETPITPKKKELRQAEPFLVQYVSPKRNNIALSKFRSPRK